MDRTPTLFFPRMKVCRSRKKKKEFFQNSSVGKSPLAFWQAVPFS